MAGSTGHFLKMNRRYPGMIGHRCAQSAHQRRFRIIIRQMAALAAKTGDKRIILCQYFPFISTHHIMIHTISMAIDTIHAGGHVNIFIRFPALGAIVGDLFSGMAIITALRRNLAHYIEKDFVTVIKAGIIINNSWWNCF